MAEGEITKYGFRWGPLEVIRACSDRRQHTILIYTKHREIQVSVSPTGRRVHVYQSKKLRRR